MFIRQNIQTLRFFRTTPAMRCPYLPHRLETKLVTELSGPDAISQHDTLTDAGFRRSHHFVYKPLCDGCRACVPVRIRVRDFEPSRAQRRILRRNEHVHAVETQPLATGEQYALFSRYVMTRHRDGDMADMDFDDYRAMVEESPVETAIIEFRDDSAEGRLVGACLVDWLSSGVSAVYSFFDPQDPRRGLGTHMITVAGRCRGPARSALCLSRLLDRRLQQDGLQARLPAPGVLRPRRLDGVAGGLAARTAAFIMVAGVIACPGWSPTSSMHRRSI